MKQSIFLSFSILLCTSFCSNAQVFLAFNQPNQTALSIAAYDNRVADENAVLNLEKQIHLSRKTIVGKRVTLKWEIPSEIQFRNYVVQRSEDGENFLDICLLHSKISRKKTNSFTDETTKDGIYYYRLAELDAEGIIKNYDPIVVAVGDITTDNYPFATIQKIGTQDKFYIKTKSTEELQVTVSTPSGMPVVCEYQPIGTYDFMITPVVPLDEGVYIVKIKNKLGEKEFKIAGTPQHDGIGF